MFIFTRSLLVSAWLLAGLSNAFAQTNNDRQGGGQLHLPLETTGKRYYDMGYRFLKAEQYDSAVAYLLPALSYYRQATRPLESAKIRNDLSIAYTELGLYDEALTLALEALKYFGKSGDSLKLASIQINTGQLYNSLRQYSQAQEYLEEAVRLLQRQQQSGKLPYLLASAANNLGTALLNNGHVDSALHYYQMSLWIKYTLGNDRSTAFTLNNIGTLYGSRGQYKEAQHYLRQSLGLKQKIGSVPGIINCYLNIGHLLLEQKKPAAALPYLDSAYALAKGRNAPALLADVYANLAGAHAQMGDYVTAYRFQERYAIINDTVNNAAIAGRTAELQTIYEVYKKDQELQAYRSRVSLMDAEGRVRTNKLALLASVTLSLIIVLLLLLRILRLNRKNFIQKEALLLQEQQLKEIENDNLRTEIGQQHQELSSLSLQSLHKKEMIQRIKEELKAVDHAAEGKTQQIVKLSRHIDHIYPEEEDWATFRANFDKVHPGFLERIGALSDSISLLDLRHCAYIKIGLITKEIAGLLNIAPESVQKSRMRLKKKLGLDKETDLVFFIQNL